MSVAFSLRSKSIFYIESYMVLWYNDIKNAGVI